MSGLDHHERSPLLPPQVFITPGRNLTPAEIDTMNKSRFEEFGSTAPIDPQPGNEDWSKLYFLARVKNELVAFGRIHSVDLIFDEKSYHILGLATVVALEKGKGYGRTLVAAMKTHSELTEQTAIGFCEKAQALFYKKCGFGIMSNGGERFYYPGPLRFENDDVIYIAGKDRLIEKMLHKPSVVADLSRPQW